MSADIIIDLHAYLASACAKESKAMNQGGQGKAQEEAAVRCRSFVANAACLQSRSLA